MGATAAVWLLDSSRMHRGVHELFAEQLSPSERRRYASIVRPQRARQFLFGRILLRIALARHMGFPPDSIEIFDTHEHVPQIKSSDSPNLPPNFSVAHSRHWIGCVVAPEAKLGIDVEVNDCTRDIIAISQAVFHPQDHRWLLSRPEQARAQMFYELWSTREALYKLATNRGAKPSFAALVGRDGNLLTETSSWHRYSFSHSDVTVIVCSDQRLLGFEKIELTDLSLEVVRSSKP